MIAAFSIVLTAPAQVPVPTPTTASAKLPPVPKIKAVDADNHNVLLNKPGVISLILCTGEDSQDAARRAGRSMYPLQGRPDFQLVVVVDLRDSLASWVPSVVTSQMRANLDKESPDLKPYFVANGNKGNPRDASHVIADFHGELCKQLGWAESSEELRGILFGADGRAIKGWNKIGDMDALQTDVRAAVQALIDLNRAKMLAAAKSHGIKLIQPLANPPPLLPPMPASALH
jgi:hypothetical protein